jgi:hypothetical protein
MTERILNSSVQVLEAYNKVRNDHSLAHANPVLNHNESSLIVDNVLSIIKFIKRMEAEADNAEIDLDENLNENMPF